MRADCECQLNEHAWLTYHIQGIFERLLLDKIASLYILMAEVLPEWMESLIWALDNLMPTVVNVKFPLWMPASHFTQTHQTLVVRQPGWPEIFPIKQFSSA